MLMFFLFLVFILTFHNEKVMSYFLFRHGIRERERERERKRAGEGTKK